MCDLLGRHWRGLYQAHEAGLAEHEWLEGLLEAAQGRAGEPGVRRLLYGIALIAAPSLAALALEVLRHAPTGSHEEPVWLGVPPTLTASPEVLMLRDAYGLRFGLLAQVTGPSAQPRTYLFDVDLCHGFHQVLDSGYHPDTGARNSCSTICPAAGARFVAYPKGSSANVNWVQANSSDKGCRGSR